VIYWILHRLSVFVSHFIGTRFIGGGSWRTRRKPPTCASHWQTLSHNVVHLALIEIRTHNTIEHVHEQRNPTHWKTIIITCLGVFHQERTGFDHHWTRILCIYSAGVCPFHLVASFKFGNHKSNVKSVERYIGKFSLLIMGKKMSLKVNYRPHRAHLFISCLNLFIWGTYQYWDILTGQWFSLGTRVSSTNKTDRHDMAEILLKMVLNTITLTPFTSWTVKTTDLPQVTDKLYHIMLFPVTCTCKWQRREP
jgi:hypothetical protein